MRKLDAAIAGQSNLKAPLFLITHSMGSIVLEEALRASDIDLNKFHTMAIFSSAGHIDESAAWFSKIKSPARYVLASKHDPVLKK